MDTANSRRYGGDVNTVPTEYSYDSSSEIIREGGYDRDADPAVRRRERARDIAQERIVRYANRAIICALVAAVLTLLSTAFWLVTRFTGA
jgi:hypothetical protein